MPKKYAKLRTEAAGCAGRENQAHLERSDRAKPGRLVSLKGDLVVQAGGRCLGAGAGVVEDVGGPAG